MSANRCGRLCVMTSLAPNGENSLRVDLSIREQWPAAFATSCIDGHGLAVEHWPGEVVR